MLLGEQTGEREFACWARNPSSVIWSIEFVGPAIEGYRLAAGVPSIRLARGDLPYHPLPYEAILSIEARSEGDSNTKEWSLVVLPDPQALQLPQASE